MRLRHLILPAVTLSAVLAACGGGGSDGPPRNAEVEPNGTRDQATAIALDSMATGTIAAESDFDFFELTVPAGGASIRFQTFDSGGTACDPVNGLVDPYIAVYDAAGGLLGGDDDSGAPLLCEDLTVALPAGTAFVMVGGLDPTPFAYTLKVTKL